MPSIRQTLRVLFGSGLCGLTSWALLDAFSSSVIHKFCRNEAISHVKSNAEFQKLLGAPVLPGPWYNDSISLTHGGHIADCKIQFNGVHRSSDIIIKVVRRTGTWGTIVYNTIGPAEWKLISCEAMIPQTGARVRRLSLMRSPQDQEDQKVK